MIELVDFNEIYGKGKEEQREGAKRTRRGGSKKKTEEKPGEKVEATPESGVGSGLGQKG